MLGVSPLEQRSRRTTSNTKRPHLSQLRVSAPIQGLTLKPPYTFSEGGSFTEGDVHIGTRGVSIASSPKSPAVADRITPDDFEIKQDGILGQGSSGVVQLAVQRSTGKRVAIKQVPLNLDSNGRKTILTELRTLYMCSHRNIVPFIGGYLQDGSVHLVLEYMDGGTIAQAIKTRGGMPEPVIGKIAASLLPALNYVHKELHIVHRDIKPSNILMNTSGEVKIGDFGVSGKLSNTIGVATTFAGTVTYMSPERINGETHSTSSDIWSFGLTLLECAMGRFPFLAPGEELASGMTFFDLLDRIRTYPTVPPAGYSDEFASFISLCLNRDSSLRPSSAQLCEHEWIKKYTNEPTNQLYRFIHTTCNMQQKTFPCSPNCAECRSVREGDTIYRDLCSRLSKLKTQKGGTLVIPKIVIS